MDGGDEAEGRIGSHTMMGVYQFAKKQSFRRKGREGKGGGGRAKVWLCFDCKMIPRIGPIFHSNKGEARLLLCIELELARRSPWWERLIIGIIPALLGKANLSINQSINQCEGVCVCRTTSKNPNQKTHPRSSIHPFIPFPSHPMNQPLQSPSMNPSLTPLHSSRLAYLLTYLLTSQAVEEF